MREISAMVLYLPALLFIMSIGAQSVDTPGLEMLTYENTDYGIMIKYPENWAVTQRQNSIAVFVAPDNDTFSNSVYVFADDLDHDGMTLDRFTDSEINGFMESLKDFRLISRNKTSVAGQLANEVVLTWNYSLQDDSQSFNLITRAIYIVSEDRSYVVSYTADSRRYRDYLEEVREMFQSFRILPKEYVESPWPEAKINENA